MSRDEMVRFDDLECFAATDLAILCGYSETDAVWLPRSQIDTDMDEKGDTGYVDVPEWLVDAKELDW